MKDFTTSDGARIAYRDQGDGRPLLLLHGLMAHSGFFTEQDALADDFRLIAVDLRGHGKSSADGALTIDRMAEDVAELADSLGLKDAIGIGWSLGASVLWKLLDGRASARFAGAIVIDMTPRVANDDDWRLGLDPEHCEARSHAIAEDFETFANAAGQAIFAQPADGSLPARAQWAGTEFARSDAAAIGAIWASLVGEDFRPLLGRIRQPTLIVHGARSHLYGADTAEHLAAGLADARIVRFDESGHSPHLEQPDLFNRTVRDFAASLPPARTPTTTEFTGRQP